MALFKVKISSIKAIFYFILLFHISHSLSALEPSTLSSKILFSIHQGNIQRAIEWYLEYFKERKGHDFELLQQIGLSLLDHSQKTASPELQLLTLLGAGVSGNEQAFYILEEGINSPIPQLQLIALNLLAQVHNDRGDKLLEIALKSDQLIVRLEALAYLAELKHPKATPHIEALMNKLPCELYEIFPPLLAASGDFTAIKSLRKLLAHPLNDVRISAIHSIAQYNRDDLLPQLRLLSTHHDVDQLEACAYALGVLGDKSSIPRLLTLSRSGHANVRLAALRSLYLLGHTDSREEIEKMALSQNLYAIYLLGEIEESKSVLYTLLKKGTLQSRINACVSLIQLRDSSCLPVLYEILIHDSRDLAFSRISSKGLGLTAWRVTTNAKQALEDPLHEELSLHLREQILEMCMDLPEKTFLEIAKKLFESQQNDLIPVLVEGLERLESEEALSLLKKYSTKAGAPLIRHSCNLALFRLKESGPYEEILRKWVTHQQDDDLIKLRPFVPREEREDLKSYQLTPQESSKLLINTFEAFAKSQNDRGVEVLLEALLYGNPNNRPVIAGLLIRSTE